MKGCLSFIFKIIVAVLIFFGLVHIGAVDFLKDKINEYMNPPQEKIIEKAKDFADLSQIGEEYSVEKDFNILKNRMIIAEHNASGQKMIMVEPKSENIITKNDIINDNFQEKLESLAKEKQYKFIKVNKIEVTKKGEMKGFNQEIPYALVKVDVTNLPVKSIEGIIGCAETENGKNIIVVSLNEAGKYSQIITEAFYEKVQ